eukprot:Hpha_TRINITY_DN15571_c2_g1::TRINITY_DN15571_c2_g1_i1::g.106226::m.106226/K14430/PHO87_91; phosphate transporter
MKFEEQLRFNAYPEWREHYINYEHLKREIYQISRAHTAVAPHSATDSEEAVRHRYGTFSLRKRGIHHMPTDDDGPPQPKSSARGSPTEGLLRSESQMKVYADMCEDAFRNWLKDERDRVATFYWTEKKSLEADLESLSDLLRSDRREALRDSVCQLHEKLVALVEFANLNTEGFRKGIKKHNKECDLPIQGFEDSVQQALQHPKPDIEANVERVKQMYTDAFCGGDAEVAAKELEAGRLERMIFERQTIWGELMAEQRAQGGKPVTADSTTVSRAIWAAVAAFVWVTVRASPILEEHPAQRECLAIVLTAAILWTTTAVPLFVTGLLIPFLVIVNTVMLDDVTGHRLKPRKGMHKVFASMFSGSVQLALGGFCIAAALSKHQIARICADKLLAVIGTRQPAVVLCMMTIALFGSAVVTNIAAPVLCCGLLQPFLKIMPHRSPLARASLMGIAVAGNLGGTLSPIASMHNIIGLHYMTADGSNVSWLSWFQVAVPVALTVSLLMWRFILWYCDVGEKSSLELRNMHAAEVPFTWMRFFVVAVSVVTIGLWCANQWIEEYVGGLGTIALIPLIAFFGTGALDSVDFAQLPWNVVVLAMGGIVLGDAVASCGLLETVAGHLAGEIGDTGLWKVLILFALITGILVCFISHTVGGMVLLPLVRSVGMRVAGGLHPKLLVFGVTLMCSGGMALPVSSFPNMIAGSQADPIGRPYLRSRDFIIVGGVGTLLCWFVVSLAGYPLMLAAGF